MQRTREHFSQSSIIPKSHSNTFLHYISVLGRKTKVARDAIVNDMMHPIDSTEEMAARNWNRQRTREHFSLTSVFPESHSNAFLNHAYVVGRGIEGARDNIADIFVHPIHNYREAATFIWDMSNGVSRFFIGGTRGSEVRNTERLKTMNVAWNMFLKGDSTTRLGMITQLTSGIILGTAFTGPIVVRGPVIKPISTAQLSNAGLGVMKRIEFVSRVTESTDISLLNFKMINKNNTVITFYNAGHKTFGQSAWRNFRSNEQGQIKITGGRSYLKANIILEERASSLYSQIRESTTDVLMIARNLNLPEFQVQRVKNHIFYNTHQLDHGMEIGRFDPDFGIASAWKRLEIGKYVESDLLLFKHEHFESRFEGIFKTDYRTAHNAANRAGHPSGLSNTEIEIVIEEIMNGYVNRY